MTQYLLLGGGFAFAATIQPGPLQAFLLTRVATIGWKRTLPACFSPLLSDGPIALVVLLLLGQVSTTVQQVLRAAGGVLLLWLAWGALRQWRAPSPSDSGSPTPRTLLQAALVNVLNPNPYLGWALVLGPAVIEAWQQHPANAVALVAAFYGTMVAMLALFILLAGSAGLLGPRGLRALVAVSVFILAALGAYLLITGAQHLVPLIGSSSHSPA